MHEVDRSWYPNSPDNQEPPDNMPSLADNLTNAGRLTRKAEKARDEAAASLTRWVLEANGKGWTKVRIAKTAGVSRTTVYNILNGQVA